MNFDRTGIILYTFEYNACVEFYEQTLELAKLFSTEDLTCFAFDSSYPMIDVDDQYDQSATFKERTRTCLRMNVPDVRALANKLDSKGIDVDFQEHSWETVAKFLDPDGNPCAFKDSETFEKKYEANEIVLLFPQLGFYCSFRM